MKAQAGFTLLELLISMTLLGLVFVLLFSGLRFGMRAWEHGTTTTGAVDSIRVAQDLLRSEVERACPRRDAPADPQALPRVDFTGASNGLTFLAPAPDAAGGGRCVRVALTVAPDGQDERLVFDLGHDINPADILRHARSIELAYFDQSSGGWQRDWQGRTELPALVRLRVTFPAGDTRMWPELFITPRISAEADCTYDPATKSCRGG